MIERSKTPFEAGYLIAVANILHLHDEPGIAECVLRELGVGKEALKRCKIDSYDAKPLLALFKEIERKDKQS